MTQTLTDQRNLAHDTLVDKMVEVNEPGLEARVEETPEFGLLGYSMRLVLHENRHIVTRPGLETSKNLVRGDFERAFDEGLAAIRKHPEYIATIKENA